MSDDSDNGETSPRLILASASPRRARLMRDYGFQITIMEPPFEELGVFREGLPPAQQAEAVSYFKARSVATLVDEGVILAGDTLVSLSGRIFGKPVDRDGARAILSALAGTTHDVITGVTLLDASSGARLVRHDATAVTMRALTRDELEAYLDTGAWRGKAGAYAIKENGDEFIERIDGSLTNVMGLPMELLKQLLERLI